MAASQNLLSRCARGAARQQQKLGRTCFKCVVLVQGPVYSAAQIEPAIAVEPEVRAKRLFQ